MFVKVKTADNYRNLNGKWLPVLEYHKDIPSGFTRVLCLLYVWDARLCSACCRKSANSLFSVTFSGDEIVKTIDHLWIPAADFEPEIYGLKPDTVAILKEEGGPLNCQHISRPLGMELIVRYDEKKDSVFLNYVENKGGIRCLFC